MRFSFHLLMCIVWLKISPTEETCPPIVSSLSTVTYDRQKGNNGEYPVGTWGTVRCNGGLTAWSFRGDNREFCGTSGWSNAVVCLTAEELARYCFPSGANVMLDNGNSVAMSELNIGDRVKAVSSNGDMVFSEIRTFVKKQPTIMGMYKSLTTSSNDTIMLSGIHLVYTRKSPSEKFYPVYTDQVSTGNEVLVVENNKLTPSRITNIDYSLMPGAYVPLTMEGNIVVEGVVASCYAAFDHDLSDIATIPIRWLPKLMEWIFGRENGSSVFVGLTMNVGQWVSSYYYR